MSSSAWFPAQSGKRWRLITVNALGTWLPGDTRGFRSRKHRIHSSGDYLNPPPRGEHLGLLGHNVLRHGRDVVIFPRDLWETIGCSLSNALIDAQHDVLAVSVVSDHAHLVVELPDDGVKIRAIVGDAKRVASRAIKRRIPGRVWSAGCGHEPIDDVAHFERAIPYVVRKQGEDAWTWCHPDVEDLL